ncbi:MAG: 16S rRNA (guanine(527)-N(7))-methyltransferase RsmG [Oscillospiraceae bacterium]|nr:16S rRNA (guanine(527)-N(7))-methyltransferase RsmG [Oscillospiraceae bacterium]
MNKADYIIEQFGRANIELTKDKAEKLVTLCDFMVEYNKNVNLTAITEFGEVVEKHFIDSVLPFTMLDISKGARFVDVGTGAGFPSLPLLICRDDLMGTLVDSLEKRCVYLRKACELLGIKAEIIHARGEELGRIRREEFDFACARAVAALPTLSEYCVPFVKVGGFFAALKSVNEEPKTAENALKELGAEFDNSVDYNLPNGDSRRLIIIKKVRQTPTKYPRSSANIKKKPL